MANVKLRCIMGCLGLKSSHQEKGIFKTALIDLMLFCFRSILLIIIGFSPGIDWKTVSIYF